MPQIQRREAWVELPTEYEGFKFKMWVNPPARLWNQVFGGITSQEIEDGLAQIILAHNDWTDQDGKQLPGPDTSEFWAEIPSELAGLIIRLAQEESQKLPSLAPPLKRR